MSIRLLLILSLSCFVLPRLVEADTQKKLTIWHTLDRKHALFLADLVQEFEEQHAVIIQLETGMELIQACKKNH